MQFGTYTFSLHVFHLSLYVVALQVRKRLILEAVRHHQAKIYTQTFRGNLGKYCHEMRTFMSPG